MVFFGIPQFIKTCQLLSMRKCFFEYHRFPIYLTAYIKLTRYTGRICPAMAAMAEYLKIFLCFSSFSA
jgi:hypothetical protein